MTTIIECLQNAKYNLSNNNPFSTSFGLAQLENAVTLLEKGYPIDFEMNGILDEYDNLEEAPDYEVQPE